MLYCESRRNARRTTNGTYIPLSQQDTRLWTQPMIDEAERELAQTATLKQLGRFQLEAAIQSVHAQRAATGQVNWEALVLLYEGLIQLAPTLGALVSQTAAIAESKELNQGLEQLNALPIKAVKNYQPFWALKAHLLKQLGHKLEAKQAYLRAIGLTEDAAIREFLLHQSLPLGD